ncbi:MAG: glycosyltransferase family 2 protein [Kiritimatiellae bacterium]|nr:glycosyltransferase family 2 protein [Kiritimatiellia bacterium]
MSIKDRLQIILITFNRCEHARRTLEEVLSPDSPVHDFDITVLDNNSVDGTDAMVAELSASHPNLHYRKNPYNLGIGGNIFRAMEIATGEYLWTICDDDIYDWSAWPDVEHAVEFGEKVICAANYIMPAEHRNGVEWPLYQMTFLPSLVISRSLFKDATMRNAFDNAFTLFPHLAPVVTHVNAGGGIYVTPKGVVTAGDRAADTSYIRGNRAEDIFVRSRCMSFMVGYANILANIRDRRLARRCMDVLINGNHKHRLGYFHFYSAVFLYFKGRQFAPHIVDLKCVLPPHRRLVVSAVRALQNSPLNRVFNNRFLYSAIKGIQNRLKAKRAAPR